MTGLTDAELAQIESEVAKHEDYRALNCLIKVDHLRRALAELRTLRSVEPASQTAFDDLLAVNEHTSNMWHEMHRVLLMALQLAHSGNHDGKSENCPTCHVVKEARRIGVVFDAETGEPLG